MSKQCDLCGKFRADVNLVLMQAEGDEQWLECKDCMSPADHEIYFGKKEAGAND